MNQSQLLAVVAALIGLLAVSYPAAAGAGGGVCENYSKCVTECPNGDLGDYCSLHTNCDDDLPPEEEIEWVGECPASSNNCGVWDPDPNDVQIDCLIGPGGGGGET